MKLPIIFSVLAFWTIPSIDNRKSEWKSFDDKAAYLKKINDLRREYAKTQRIPNMNELVWDDFLETRAQTQRNDCNLKTCRETLLDGVGNAATNAIKRRESWESFDQREQLMKNLAKYRIDGVEVFTPGQERIGCAPQQYEFTMNDGTKVVFDTTCYMEPDGTGASWNHTLAEAGSACPKGFQNEDGLCAPPAKPSAEKSISGESGNSGNSETSKNGTASASGENTEANGSVYINFLSSMILIVFYQIL